MKKGQVTPEQEIEPEDDGLQDVSDDGGVFAVDGGEKDANVSDAEEAGDAGEDDEDDENGEGDPEWNGLESGAVADSTGTAPHTGRKPRKPPTGEEVRNIREATDLFRSNSFKFQVRTLLFRCVPVLTSVSRVQIDVLLPNVRPKDSRRPPLDRFLLDLHECLAALPSVAPVHPLEAARALLDGRLFPGAETHAKTKGKGKTKTKGKAKEKKEDEERVQSIAVPYPLPLPTEDTNWKVAFERPAEVVLVGSWANKTIVKAQDGEPWTVDVAIEMPSVGLPFICIAGEWCASCCASCSRFSRKRTT